MPASDYFDGLSIRTLLLHPAIWFLLATGLVIFGATHLWEQKRFQIVSVDQYNISDSRIRLNPPPEWFATDLTGELHNQVFNSATLLDIDLVPRTAEFLSNVPWVQRINKISKQPDGLEIELKYREPVAVIGKPNNISAVVDSEGVVFDLVLLSTLDLSRLENDLLHISIPRLDIRGISPWQNSADERIAHASSLCEFLNPVASELKLYRVVTFDLPSLNPESSPQLEIWTKNKSRIIWGASPGFETGSEASPEVKLAAIRNFVANNGQLEEFKDRGIRGIDVKNGFVKLVELRRLAEFEELSELLK